MISASFLAQRGVLAGLFAAAMLSGYLAAKASPPSPIVVTVQRPEIERPPPSRPSGGFSVTALAAQSGSVQVVSTMSASDVAELPALTAPAVPNDTPAPTLETSLPDYAIPTQTPASNERAGCDSATPTANWSCQTIPVPMVEPRVAPVPSIPVPSIEVPVIPTPTIPIPTVVIRAP